MEIFSSTIFFLLALMLQSFNAHNTNKQDYESEKRLHLSEIAHDGDMDTNEADENVNDNDANDVDDEQVDTGTKFLFETMSSFEESGSSNERLPRTPIINTRYGKIQGRIHSLPGNDDLAKVEVYHGIPYATPPVSSNRWQPTRAPSPWEGILQATTPGPVCPQKLPDVRNETEALLRMPKQRLRFLQMVRPQLLRQSEDCLYLNIFVPVPENMESSQGETIEERRPIRPIMIYVHGESFSWGSGNLWDGRVLASFGNVIVITFNFRLGILGFLNTNGSPLTRGQVANYGIMDQIAVLQWVQENASKFGGDPTQVTLFGHGTGAACIEYLAHSPTTVPGLFRRVILMSGSLFASWARVRDPLNYALQLGKYFNCTIPNDLTNDHNQIVDCLRGISAERLLAAKLEVPSFHLDFGPSFDGVTVKDNFAEIKGKRSFGSGSYDAMVGVVTHDYFNALSDEDLTAGISQQQRDRMLQTFVRNHYNAHLQEILLTLQNEYTDWQQVNQHPTTIRDMVLQAFSDALYVSPAVYSSGTFLRRTKNVYFYHFAHRSKMDPYGQLRSGSIHGSELAYVFGIPLCNVWRHVLYQFTKSEIGLSKAVMTYWTNFAKTGSPNTPTRSEDSRNRFRAVQWDQYDEHQKYFELGLRPRILHHFRGHKMAVWLNLIPQLQKTGQNSIYPSHNSLTLEGPAWGVVRNSSHVSRPNIDSKVLDPPPGTACMTLAESQRVLHQHNSTLKRLEAASKDAYSYALAVALSLGGILCLLNGILLLYLCRRNGNSNKRGLSGGADQTATHSEISRSGSELDFFAGSADTPRRSNFSGSSLPRGGRRTILLQQRDQGSLSSNGPRRFSSSSDGRYVSAPRPDLPSDVTPLTSEMSPSPIRPGSSMSTATIRFRPSGASTTSRCQGHHRPPQQRVPHQHHHSREDRMSLTLLHSDSPSPMIGQDEIPAPPAPFSQTSPDNESPAVFRANGYAPQIR